MKKHSRVILTLFILYSIIGCAQLAKHSDTIKPTAKLTGTSIANIGFDKVNLVFDLAVTNNNPVALKLTGLDYELKIDNQSLLSGVTAQAISLKANSTSSVQLPITLKFADLKKLSSEVWSKDTINYHLKTNFNIKLPVIGNYAIPVEKQGELPVPKIPQIKVKDVKIKQLGFTSAELVAQIEVSNPNDFKLQFGNIDYQLTINQQDWGQGKINKDYSIPKKGKAIIEIPLKLDLLSIGSAAYKILLNKSAIEYHLTGSATLDTGLELFNKQKLPFDIQGSTSFM